MKGRLVVMKISTKGRYALRMMCTLAANDNGTAIPLRDIAESQNISVKYLEQIVILLSRAGFVKSVRGAQGGYILKRSPKDISVGDVLRALEGDLRPVDCLAIEDENETHCENADLCVTKYVWTRISESINDTVNSITLQDLLNQNKEKNSDERICDCGL